MSDDWWDDFTNNLATDFAPLVALFGESPTKQYLSECLTATDILIFATAPLGVITAVVSAIRVCGTPSLRAFIGRAQEGAGNAEAELCSSTSRDVCELYNNGGIARVFGRPKLLEIVYDSSASLDDFFDNKEGGHPTAGIYSFEEFKNSKDTEEPSEWQEVYGRSHANFQTLKQYVLRQERRQNKEKGFAPNPNLSLNVGIKPRGKLWFYAAAAFGVALQSAVLVWAALARYWFHLVRHDVQDKYAVPFTIVGTIFLDFGVGLCAYLVERSTKERVFTRKYDLRTGGPPPRPRTRIYWVQPGNQVIGDQIFDSFAYTDFNTPLIKYTTSWKQDEVEEGAISTMKLIWAAVLFSLVGFVLQFIGLRACHSSVSLAQLAITVVMSIVRASLRTQRMEKKDNLTKDANLFQGHELDWLALEINRPTGGRTDWCKDCRHLWMVFSGHSSSTFQDYEERFEIEIPKDDSKHRILRLGFGSFGSRAPVGLCRIQDDGCNENQYRRIYNVSELHPSYPGPNEIIHQQTLEASTKSFFHRIRLARMTGLDDFDSSTSRKWDQTLVSVRHTAELLANAIEATASVLFITDTTPPIEIENRWKNSFAMFCPFDIAVRGCKDSDSKNGVSTSFFTLRREEGPNPEDPPEGPWQADRAELESILGLWTWSLMNRAGYPSQVQGTLDATLQRICPR
ncbi:hypothetical protein BFW01_g7567 [Lasiodiplodia theobromae]|nr:hypothetical protein BFW01_g7567 [Lasiodiplodia theobromae]